MQFCASILALYQIATLQFVFFSLHRLVGLRLLRLCLKLRQGFALYPQWVSPLDPDQGRVPGPFARFARCFILLYACNLLWSAMLIPHSSLKLHSSLSSYCILILFKQSTLLGVEQLVNDIANSRSVQPTSLQKSIAFISKYLKSQT